jgi:hypothetical protein
LCELKNISEEKGLLFQDRSCYELQNIFQKHKACLEAGGWQSAPSILVNHSKLK